MMLLTLCLRVSASSLYIDVDGVKMVFQILDEQAKEVQVGNGHEAAIPAGTAGTLNIPETVAIDGTDYKVALIADSAFFACNRLTSVSIPGTVARISSYAFYGCTSLAEVGIAVGVYSIRAYAFYGCTTLEAVDMPCTLGTVGDHAFEGCAKLRSVTCMSQYPEALGTDAFAGISAECLLRLPIGKLTRFDSLGWTRQVFKGGITEIGEAEENYCIENATVSAYMRDVTYPDDDYSFTRITDYTAPHTCYLKCLPQPVCIKAPAAQDGRAMIVDTYRDGLAAHSDTFCIGQRLLEIYNLLPKAAYSYRISIVGHDGEKREAGRGTFRTEGQVRMLYVIDIGNIRDLGGWALPEGRHVRYGQLFRSDEIGYEEPVITAGGIRELVGWLGIGVEIDFGDYSDDSPIKDRVEFFHGPDYQIIQYANGLETTSEQYRNCFMKLVSSLREGKRVLFHCSAGADRTGTLAFLLEGLLGVAESDMAKDYELTSFYTRKRLRSPNGVGYYQMVKYVKDTYPGRTLQEKIERMALAFGIPQQDIDDFRSLMTEPDGIPTASDIAGIVNILLGRAPATGLPFDADINCDGAINIADIVALVKLIQP